MRCCCLAVRDPGELDILVNRQVDHPAGCPCRSGQPAQRRPFIAAPEPEVEHDAGPQSQHPQGNQDELPLQHEALAVRHRVAEQRDHPLVRSEPKRAMLCGQLFRPRGLSCPGKPDYQEQRRHVVILHHADVRSHAICAPFPPWARPSSVLTGGAVRPGTLEVRPRSFRESCNSTARPIRSTVRQVRSPG